MLDYDDLRNGDYYKLQYSLYGQEDNKDFSFFFYFFFIN